MAWSFGDGFDLYAAPTDAVNGYWDSGGAVYGLTAGRFAGSRAMSNNATNQVYLVKNSGANDAVHHLVVAFQTAAIGSPGVGMYLQLLDGATAQVCVVFGRNGDIQLESAIPTGTALSTYVSAVTASNTWYAFEIEIVIHPTAGSWAVRKNGNTVADFSATGLNTRPGANSYANRLQVGMGNTLGMTHTMDDLYWRSDAASVPWMGDIRCYTRMPASDASVQFSRVGGATNASRVSEAQQDGTTTYVYDGTPGHADLYGIAAIALTPATTVAVTTRGYLEKSDGGARTAAVQLKSGSTTVAAPTIAPASWLWAWRTDTTDPATGAAWTASAVNNTQIGPSVVT